MMRPLVLRAVLAALLATFAAQALAESALPSPRPANTALRIDGLPRLGSDSVEAVNAFPQLQFTEPIALQEAPDGSGEIYLLERRGRLLVFPKDDPTPERVRTLLDLRDEIETGFMEHGFLGLALPPDFAGSRDIYLCYTPVWREMQVVRWNLNRPFTEAEVLLTQPVVSIYHLGGTIRFGLDGMLLIGMGDGDLVVSDRSQDTTILHGKLLRIDVLGTPDAGRSYAIPKDNPFLDGGPAGPQTRPEIYAYGLRNPWGFSTDRATGVLWLGDVGLHAFEEINRVTAGANFGWPYYEGDHCRVPERCGDASLTPPILVQDHTQNVSIILGFVSQNPAESTLYGQLLFADWYFGKLYATDPYAPKPVATRLSSGLDIQPTAIVEGADGEIWLLDWKSGGIHTLRQKAEAPEGEDTFPRRLSDLPALLAAGKGEDLTALGVVPYQPASELWSDGARKERYMALPGLRTTKVTDINGFDFPNKSILLKNFILPLDEADPSSATLRLETRMLYRYDGRWHGFSYRWNEEQTDADLVHGEG